MLTFASLDYVLWVLFACYFNTPPSSYISMIIIGLKNQFAKIFIQVSLNSGVERIERNSWFILKIQSFYWTNPRPIPVRLKKTPPMNSLLTVHKRTMTGALFTSKPVTNGTQKVLRVNHWGNLEKIQLLIGFNQKIGRKQQTNNMTETRLRILYSFHHPLAAQAHTTTHLGSLFLFCPTSSTLDYFGLWAWAVAIFVGFELADLTKNSFHFWKYLKSIYWAC